MFRVAVVLALVASASALTPTARPAVKAAPKAAPAAPKAAPKVAPKAVAKAAAPKAAVKAAPAPKASAPKASLKAAASPKAAVDSSAFASELGALPPVGFFDPANLAKDQETFDRFRALEVKHGRICQLAVLGYIAPELWRWPGEIAPGLKFADVPHGIAAINAIPSLGWVQIIFAIGAVDYWGFFGNFEVGKIGSSISQGGILALTDEQVDQRKTQEIQHGRLAMLGFLELLRHDWLNYSTGNDLDHFIIGLPYPY